MSNNFAQCHSSGDGNKFQLYWVDDCFEPKLTDLTLPLSVRI